MDEIDEIIVDGLKDYVDVKNIALKDQRQAGQYIVGGKLKSTPAEVSAFEQALSLGITAMNESSSEPLAAPIPDIRINREIHARLVEHFKGHTNHGLRSALAGMGLVSEEKQQFTVRDRVTDAARLDHAAHRAADRAMELITGRQSTAGYPMTRIPVVGGHGIGRATSIRNEQPEQIMYNGNMEVEGALEGMARHEYRGREAARLAGNKLLKFLASDEINAKDAMRVIDTLAIIQRSRPRRWKKKKEGSQ